MAFICGLLSLLLIIISMSSTHWLYSTGYRQGLWEECIESGGSTTCQKNPKTGKGAIRIFCFQTDNTSL